MCWTLFWRVRVEFGIVVLLAYCSLAAQNNKWHRVRVLVIECRYLSDFCLLRHSKYAPICLLMKKVEMHRSSTAKKGSPNSVTDFWGKIDQNRAFLACFRPCNDPCMTIKSIFLLSCLIPSYMNTLSSLLPAGCSRTGRYSLQKGPWRITGTPWWTCIIYLG